MLAELLRRRAANHQPRRVLDIAPHPQVRRVLHAVFPDAQHVGADLLEPERPIEVRADMTAAPFRDGVFDLVVCYHVLEHIPDDAAAIAEVARVLAPGGLGLVQVPHRPTAPTDEDPDAPEAERVERFGQADHVRYYGKDLVDRLRAGGLAVAALDPGDALGDERLAAIGGRRAETVWLVQRAADGEVATGWTADEPRELPPLLPDDPSSVGRRGLRGLVGTLLRRVRGLSAARGPARHAAGR